MAKKAFDKIMVGLEDAVAHAEGDRSKGIVHKVKIRDVARRRRDRGCDVRSEGRTKGGI